MVSFIIHIFEDKKRKKINSFENYLLTGIFDDKFKEKMEGNLWNSKEYPLYRNGIGKV